MRYCVHCLKCGSDNHRANSNLCPVNNSASNDGSMGARGGGDQSSNS